MARQGKARQRQRKQMPYPPTHAQNPRVTKVHETVLAKRNKERSEREGCWIMCEMSVAGGQGGCGCGCEGGW